jgi:formylglycine-generating enzyme required for sulfatase activity
MPMTRTSIIFDVRFLGPAATGHKCALTLQTNGETVLSTESNFFSPWQDELSFKEDMVRVGLDKDYGTLTRLQRLQIEQPSIGVGIQEPIRMIESPDERNIKLEEIGQKLLQALVDSMTDQSNVLTRRLDDQTELWIRLINLPAGLVSYPWEAMHDGNEFLVLQPRIVICRYTPSSTTYRPLPKNENDTSVYVITSTPRMPTGFQDILADRHKSHIRKHSQEKMKSSPYQVDFWDDLAVLGDVRADLVSKASKGRFYRIVHFIGHGAYSDAEQRPSLYWQRAGGEPDRQPARNLMSLIRGNTIRLVVFDACETVRAAMELTTLGLPVAIGMLQKLRPQSGELFCEGFYQGLSWGLDIIDSLRNAREHMRVNNSEDWLMPILVTSVQPHEASLIETSPARIQNEAKIGVKESKQLEENWILVPSGTFWMGSNPKADPQAFKDEIPQHELRIPYDFAIARYPTTIEEFVCFIEDGGYDNPEYWSTEGWVQRCREQWSFPNNLEQDDPVPDLPITVVSWYEAIAYCKWLSMKTSCLVRLPTEAEWEKAARGTSDKRVYPWGNFWDSSRCNTRESGIGHITSVRDYHKRGCSPYGCCDMAGNVFEWTISKWGANFRYPYILNGERERTKHDNSQPRVIRGGSFLGTSRLARCSYRTGSRPSARSNHIGFRVVKIG